jgi:hypothetical protein
VRAQLCMAAAHAVFANNPRPPASSPDSPPSPPSRSSHSYSGLRSDVEVLIKVNSTLYAVLTGFDINPASNGFVSAYMTRRLAMNASYVRALGGGGEPAGWS